TIAITDGPVLLFGGTRANVETDVALRKLAERIERAFPGLVVARVIGAAGHTAHRLYGVSAATAFAIRPDAYIAHRAEPVDDERLIAELTARLS
ncbi:FAD-dependent monooxygenase, partial [Nocardia gipuzkoensis]